MDTLNKSAQQCPGPTKSARSRVESLREKRERLRDELRLASARLAEAEAKADRLQRIESRRQERLERDQLGSLCKRVGLDRYRLPVDANNPDAPAPLDAELIGGVLRWLIKSMDAMSPEDLDLMREEGALIQEMQDKKDASGKKAAHNNSGSPSSSFKPSTTFDPV